MLVILSPSKKMNEELNSKNKEFTIPSLISNSFELVQKIKNYEIEDVTKVMSISYGQAEQTLERFKKWNYPFSLKNAKQAILSYSGDVYENMNASDFTTAELKQVQLNFRILSGLYGILKPLDLIQPYRLEMATKMLTARGVDLYKFWGNLITEELNTYMLQSKKQTIVNLSSIEYFKAINLKKINNNIITPIFRENKNNKLRVASFYAKQLRGLMSRFIIKNNITNIEDIKQFNMEGYSFDPKKSDDKSWLFIKNI